MPVIHVHTSETPSTAARSRLLSSLSSVAAEQLKKPERYVMTCLHEDVAMTFAGTEGRAAYVEVKNIGHLSESLTSAMSAAICDVIDAALGVPKDRIYIEFTNVEAHLFGWNGGTFA